MSRTKLIAVLVLFGTVACGPKSGPVFYKSECESGSAIHCALLANAYLNGLEGLVADPDQAFKLYDTACKGGDSQGCAKLGTLYEIGTAVAKDPIRASSLYLQACDGGAADGCANLGVMTRAADATRAAGLFERGCGLGSGVCCLNLADMLLLGEGTAYDAVRAAELYSTVGSLLKVSCDQGSMDDCFVYAKLQMRGAGENPDKAAAEGIFSKACDSGNATGCTVLGWLHYKGRAAAPDGLAASNFFRKACDLGDATGCTGLGAMYTAGVAIAQDHLRAAEYYVKGCDLGSEPGCTTLATMYTYGVGVVTDGAKAAELNGKACKLRGEADCSYYENYYGGYDDYGYYNGGYDQAYGTSMVVAPELNEMGCEFGDGDACWKLGTTASYSYTPAGNRKAFAYYQMGCTYGSPDGCLSLGWLYMYGTDGVPADPEKAKEIIGKACEGGSAVACSQLADSLVWSGNPTDQLQALDFYGKGCDLGDATGCMALGRNYSSGYIIASDPVKALEFFDRACEVAQGGWTCSEISSGYGYGYDVMPVDLDLAARFLSRSCEKGDSYSCSEAGRRFSVGEGVTQDQAKAASSYLTACSMYTAPTYGNAYDPYGYNSYGSGDAWSCVEVGRRYSSGNGLPQDPWSALTYFELTCNDSVTAGCSELAKLYRWGVEGIITKDTSRASEMLRKACDSWDTVACVELGDMYEKGETGSKDDNKALEMFRRGCDYGAVVSCVRLGRFYRDGRGGLGKDASQAAYYFQQACSTDYGYAPSDPYSCGDLAELYEKGEGVAKDEVKAVSLYQMACEVDNGKACGLLGDMQKDGRGGLVKDKTLAAAKEYWAKGCSLEDEHSCKVKTSGGGGGGSTLKCTNEDAKLFTKLCSLDDGDSCASLADLYENGAPDCPKDKAKSKKYLKSACTRGHDASCTKLTAMGETVTGSGNRTGGSDLDKLTAACQAGGSGAGPACAEAGERYEQGRGVTPDKGKAQEFFAIACAAGHKKSCQTGPH